MSMLTSETRLTVILGLGHDYCKDTITYPTPN
jgi:hypothetical protein